MKKNLIATGPNGKFEGHVRIIESKMPVNRHNPSTHEDEVVNVKCFHVNAFVGITLQENLSQKDVTESNLIESVNYVEKVLQNILNDMANRKSVNPVELKLNDMGYK